MNRAERRRIEKENKRSSTATYNITKEQLDRMVREGIDKELKQAREEAYNLAVNDAMVLLLTLPCEVLMDYYWKKSYARKIPEFVQHVLKYYDMWTKDELDMDKMKEDLWEYGGVRLQTGDVTDSE